MIVDTNVVIRFLLGDIPDQAEEAERIFIDHDVYLPFEIVIEVIHVLDKIYSISRKEISGIIISLIKNYSVDSPDNEVLLFGLKTFSRTNLGFADCMLAGYHTLHRDEVKTFDKKLMNHLKK